MSFASVFIYVRPGVRCTEVNNVFFRPNISNQLPRASASLVNWPSLVPESYYDYVASRGVPRRMNLICSGRFETVPIVRLSFLTYISLV